VLYLLQILHPRTQAGRSGTGDSGRAGPALGRTPATTPRRHRPYAADLRHHHRHRAWPPGRDRSRPYRVADGPGLGGNKPPPPGSAILPGPVPPVPGRCRLRSGRDCSQSTGWPATRAGGPVPFGPGPGGYPGCCLGALVPGAGMPLPTNGSRSWCQSSDQGCRPAACGSPGASSL
jgi:hypothetical protein